MPKALIKIAYRQIIDASSQTEFERKVFHASYDEFILKCQAYNLEGKYKTFSEMKAADGRANSLHYKSGFVIGNFINELKNLIPGLYDTLGRNISFETYEFKVIESDITNKAAHEVAVIYLTSAFTLHQVIGEYMLLSAGDITKNESSEPAETFLFKVQPNLSIFSFQEI